MFSIVVLSLSGLLLFFVGAMRLTNPIKTYAKNSGIALENDVNLLNEVRGTSALMLIGGAIVISGAVVPTMTFSSHVVATLLLLGFAVGRTLSMRLDGKPNKLLIQGLLFELVLGSLAAAGLVMSLV